jgi:3-dehydroquinate synthase
MNTYFSDDKNSFLHYIFFYIILLDFNSILYKFNWNGEIHFTFMLTLNTQHPCHIVITDNELNALGRYFKNEGIYPHCVIISDENVFPIYGAELSRFLQTQGISTFEIILPAGESNKTLETASQCWLKMHAEGLDRHSLVIGLGGGMVTDLAGFIAAGYMRGIDVIHLPTTLLGMCDAAIGGKTGVNLPTGKNVIGSIHHPKLVVIAPRFLQSLPERELRSGLAEVVKYGVVWDADFFHYLERHVVQIVERDAQVLEKIIARSCEIKAEIVQQDDQDKNIRAILNWGHTFAHAIETATHYTRYTHGEAVAIGMSCAAHVSHALGYASKELINRQDTLCQQLGLATAFPDLSLDVCVQLMAKDKKAADGKISLILAEKIGKVQRVHAVDPGMIKKVLEAKVLAYVN